MKKFFSKLFESVLSIIWFIMSILIYSFSIILYGFFYLIIKFIELFDFEKYKKKDKWIYTGLDYES